MDNTYTIRPIGIIHSPHKSRQAVLESNVGENVGEVEVFEEYEEGLSDIDGFSHIILIFWMHESTAHSLRVRPFRHPEELRGLFATRSPDRPNPVGMTVVELLASERNVLKVRGIDMIDGTPLIDIKPYTTSDRKTRTCSGWLSEEDRTHLDTAGETR